MTPGSSRPGPHGSTIRRATSEDGPSLGDVWLRAWRATFTFPPAHPDDDVRRWLATEMLPRTETWVATEAGGRVVAFLSISTTMVEQLYVDPDWIGRGLGSVLLDIAKERRPDGLELWCFQVNHRARRFYGAHGFRAVFFGGGAGNEERQPDIRYAWTPDGAGAVAPGNVGADTLVAESPSRPDTEPWQIAAPDGSLIAAFRSGTPVGPPLILVHGAAADHTTFRVVGPRFGAARDVIAIDRRGRGDSTDTLPYAIEREFEDVAAVAEAIAAVHGVPAVDVFGHSYGGRCALGAALRTAAIRRVVSYEGAPTPPGERYGDAALAGELVALADSGQDEALLTTFMTRVVGMTRDELDRYRADPVWPRRVAAAPTIARELLAEGTDAAGIDALGAVEQPVLQLLGGESIPAFGAATRALDGRLALGRIVTIPGAKHAAHHTHPDAVVEAVTAFLDGPV